MNIKSISKIVEELGRENFENQRVQSFLHSGSLGDVIFSLPLIIGLYNTMKIEND